MHNRIASAACALALLLTPAAAPAADMSSVAKVVKPVPGGTAWTPAQVAALRRYIDGQILTAPTLRNAIAGLEVVDTVRGTVLYSKNADTSFMPASNFKLLVGSTVLRRLGTNFAFVTKVESDGAPQGGAIHGNLYLRGGGDAHLSAKDLDDAAAALAASGVRTVDGALITDASHFDAQRYGDGWSWDDLPYYYAPPITALELEDGIVHVTMTPGSAAGDPVQLAVSPQSGAFTIDNLLRTGPKGSKDDSDIVHPWDAPNTIEFTGNYPVESKASGDLRPAVPDPAAYAGDVLLRALQAHGIAVSGGVHAGVAPAGTAVLWTHESEKLPELLADFWYPSDNLMGELFLKELGVAQAGEPGTDANGRIAEQQFLRSIGVDPSSVSIADGSGLSHYDHITPADFVAILQADWNSPFRDIVLNALPVPGFRGTMLHAYEGSAAVGNAFLKDGVISHVRTLSGYVKTRSHGPITFSWQINSWMGEGKPDERVALARLRAAFLSHFVNQ
jgi:D-alanyl-D-alanine carboxypeptidase/D-alanyl-D-alanine-endopeptidase (penicillin-binding protein 4)